MSPVWKRHPFLAFGLPFMAAVLVGFGVLAEIRTSRYARPRNARVEALNEREVAAAPKRTLKSLEEELQEWEEKAKKQQQHNLDYEMKPVRQ